MDNEIYEFISQNTTPDIAKQYADFCDWIHSDSVFNPLVTSSVFASLDFKKKLAKKIVNDLLYENNYKIGLLLKLNSLDVRLLSLVNYYLAVEILNHNDLPETTVQKARTRYSRASYIKGWQIDDNSPEAIVKMRPNDTLYQGYRFFLVNMLCFTAEKFVLGVRTDSGPVSPMKYYKGCKPLGRKTSSDGITWDTILFDRSLSDDHVAVFSNELDGDGTIEMCDWLSDYNYRIIYRHSY